MELEWACFLNVFNYNTLPPSFSCQGWVLSFCRNVFERSRLLIFPRIAGSFFPFTCLQGSSTSSFFDYEDRLVYREVMLVHRSERKLLALECVTHINRKRNWKSLSQQPAPFSQSYLGLPSRL